MRPARKDARADIAHVELTHSGRGDTRVLLTRADSSVLAQDSGYWYSDASLTRLASAIGCNFLDNPRCGFAELERAHPGTFRYRWERYPTLWGFALGAAIAVPLLLVAFLTR